MVATVAKGAGVSRGSDRQGQVEEPKQGRRLVELDALRGLAALGVVLFHYYYHVFEVLGPEERMNLFFVYGQYGVELFFMISGFVIFMSLERTKRAADFVVSRFARLFPVYWLSIGVTTAVVWMFGLPGREVSGMHTLINLTMLTEFANVPKVDGAFWTLTLELCFYVLAGVAWFSGALKQFHLCATVSLAGLVAGQLVTEGLGVAVPWKVSTFLLLGYGHLFLLGMVLYTHWKDEADWRSVALGLGCIGLAFFQGVLVGCLVIGFTGMFLAIRAGWLRFLAVRPLLFLGAISYSLYIVHQNAGFVVLRELTDLGMSWPLAQLVVLGLAILVAAAMTYGVERPTARVIRRLWKGRSAAVSKPALRVLEHSVGVGIPRE